MRADKVKDPGSIGEGCRKEYLANEEQQEGPAKDGGEKQEKK